MVRPGYRYKTLLYSIGWRSWALPSSYIAIADIEYTDQFRLPLTWKDFGGFASQEHCSCHWSDNSFPSPTLDFA
jgi:hypothetical protein